MKHTATKIALVFLATALSATAFGQEKMKRKKKGGGAATESVSETKASYGMSGCGLGTMVMKKDTMMDQVLAATTSYTGGQTLAISTGTSGCNGVGPSSRSNALKIEEQRVFVTNNLSTLERESAQGGGETIASLAIVSGCTDEALPTFEQLTQASHEELFASNDPLVIVDSLNAKIAADETLAEYCM